jgi:hypothetical protein
MTRKKEISSIVFSLILICFLAVPGVAEEGPEYTPVAEMSITSTAVTWQPRVEYKSLLLRIATPMGNVIQKAFTGSSAPYFDLAMHDGNPLVDGVYTYELVVIPQMNRMPGKGIPSGRDAGENLSGGLSVPTIPTPPLTQSGSFSIFGGKLVTPSNEGLSSTMDIVHNDDVIITFSLCVGNDCVNGESFGFDTLRLKENNLRIHFQDTSSSASFPTNDWRIIANDSSNGGASYLAFEDSNAGRQVFRVDAGAPANSLRVDSSGDVGIGTATPAVDAHIVSGNTPTLRLEQNGSSGFTPQTWDVAGNEANFFVRDVTNGSQLPFRIKPGADTDSLYITADGDIGMGTSSPDAKLHPETSEFPVLKVENTAGSLSAGSAIVEIKTASSNPALVTAEKDGGAMVQFSAGTGSTFFGSRSNHPLNLIVNALTMMYVDTSGNVAIKNNSTSITAGRKIDTDTGAYLTSGGVWQGTSTRAAKENIVNLTTEEAIDALKVLNPVKFNYKKEKNEDYIGFIAEDVPELVATKDRKAMNAMDVVAVLTKVLQQQQKVVAEQQKTIAELKKEVRELKKQRGK